MKITEWNDSCHRVSALLTSAIEFERPFHCLSYLSYSSDDCSILNTLLFNWNVKPLFEYCRYNLDNNYLSFTCAQILSQRYFFKAFLQLSLWKFDAFESVVCQENPLYLSFQSSLWSFSDNLISTLMVLHDIFWIFVVTVSHLKVKFGLAIMFCVTLGAQAFSDLHKPTAANPFG